MALLAVSGLEKSFPGVKALKDGRLTLEPGEIHARLGVTACRRQVPP